MIHIYNKIHKIVSLVSIPIIIISFATGFILSIYSIKFHVTTNNSLNIPLIEFLKRINSKNYSVNKILVTKKLLLEGFDNDGNNINYYINNKGDLIDKYNINNFKKKLISIHRSLLLGKIGRIIIYISTLLLIISIISGLCICIYNFSIIIKKNNIIKYHLLIGVIFSMPIIIISISGIICYYSNNNNMIYTKDGIIKKNIKINLKNIDKIYYDIDDKLGEIYIATDGEKEIIINKTNLKIEKIKRLTLNYKLLNYIYKLHIGALNIYWAIILNISCLSGLYICISGIYIFFKKNKKIYEGKLNPKYPKVVILVGSTYGNTLKVSKKLYDNISLYHYCILDKLDNYNKFNNIEILIIMTSNYSNKTAPCNGRKFEKMLIHIDQKTKKKYFIIGFGSKKYKDFCGYTKKIYNIIKKKEWAQEIYEPLYINEEDYDPITNYIIKINYLTNLNIDPYFYLKKDKKIIFQKTVVIDIIKSYIDKMFILVLKKNKEKSGDLMNINIPTKNINRLYSISIIEDKIYLFIKLHEKGIASNYLYNVNKNYSINYQIIKNIKIDKLKKNKTPIILMICNGSGIAGIISQLKYFSKSSIYVYCGLRYKDNIFNFIEKTVKKININNNIKFKYTFSKSEKKIYISELILRDIDIITKILHNKNNLIIFGSNKMKNDVINIINKGYKKKYKMNLDVFWKSKNFIDECY